MLRTLRTTASARSTASRTRTPRRLAVGGLLGLSLLVSACAADDVSSGGTASEGSSSAGTTVVVGGANFTEMQVMQAMYVAVLEDAGYTTDTVTVENRELYYDQLATGAIGVVPEYAATLTEFLNQKANGADAAPIATSDAAATVTAAQPLAEADGVELLEPAEAADQNGFAVTSEFAAANGGLTTLTELGALGQPLVLASTEECPTRPFCQLGLESTYGLTFSSSLPLGFSTSQTKSAVQSGEAQLGLVATTDGTLDQFDLVLLDDDKGLQLADNLVPAVNAELASDQALVDALNGLSAVLTTDDLAALNSQVDSDRLLPADVATAYLQDKGLIS